MKLATIRTPDGTRAVRVEDARAVEIGVADVGTLLARPDWRQLAETASGPEHTWDAADTAPVVPGPGKIFCVGLNYRTHILEMGRDLPRYPTLFAKFTETLTGPGDDIELPIEDPQIDWEAELAVVIGHSVRRADEKAAARAIAGYTLANDVSMRGYQFRTKEWLQGKIWESSTPVGPMLVTPDEWQPGGIIRTTLNGEKMQEASTADLVHDPVFLVQYISAMLTLNPGDLILTGTPGGVGHARNPARYITSGDVVEVSVDGLGELRNRFVVSPSTSGPGA
ncbi:fumarylacetoacetate hydrolase family protein [Kineosporia sp. NBRC 101731]|uniref:fumarylacetoacetate hydrolase family protein n=1 Tax=Kineosporia sp. NBRC 101731 TaxID=3032199 RepID=UPI0024A1A4E4|nr:fumarylacetoacetate hydrolase family protein [Kineosporia sp. NBRC 101731]GLY29727.1 2-hydroxyhepta-2,4-diene-1,7-dioate isomerase [Kineosporia sp. NBRC 101731]